MAAAGFTINTLTMFGLVLAIGLLVDDAIVVVENVERIMTEEGLSPVEATRKAMGPDQRRARRRGHRAFRGVRSDCLFRRLRRRDLSPVLADDRLGHAAVGVRGAVAHARALLAHN